MITANIATAKNELSRLLRRVKRGERVIITDRNRPVAQLQPFSPGSKDDTDDAVAALHEIGVLTPPSGARLDVVAFLASPAPVLSSKNSLAAAVLAEREDGR